MSAWLHTCFCGPVAALGLGACPPIYAWLWERHSICGGRSKGGRWGQESNGGRTPRTCRQFLPRACARCASRTDGGPQSWPLHSPRFGGRAARRACARVLHAHVRGSKKHVVRQRSCCWIAAGSESPFMPLQEPTPQRPRSCSGLEQTWQKRTTSPRGPPAT